MKTEDGYIIHKCLEGDQAAFGLLVDKYKAGIYALAYSKIRNFHDAQDIAQEVFIKIYKKLHTLKRQDSFLAWIHTITSNLCKDWIRARSKRPDAEYIEDQDPSVFDHSSVSSYRERLMHELIRDALDSLPERYREVLTLYYLGGMDSVEIAKFLGISPVAVRQQLSRARARLKEEMLIMMSATFEQYKLQPAFTFRIVEIVKHIRFHPFPRMPWLPWGLSLVTGTVLTILGFITYPIILSPNVDWSSLEAPIEARVLEIGEVPVDVVKVSDVPIIGGRGVQLNAPTLRDALAFLFAPQAGEGKWTEKADIPTPRAHFSTSVVDDKIYVIGSLEGVNALPIVEVYNPASDSWSKKADMPTARRGSSASAVNGKIYVIGGAANNMDAGSFVEEYDPLTDKWTKKADMPTARLFLSTSVVNGKIYAIGGNPGGSGRTATVEEYDPATDTWTKKANMPTARAGLSTSVVNGKIYAFGGSPSAGAVTATVEEYNPLTDTWTKKTDMPTARWFLSCATVGGKIYALGGFPIGGSGPAIATVEAYDPDQNKWTKKAAMPTARGSLSTSVVQRKIYAIGGSPNLTVPGPPLGPTLSKVEEYNPGFAGEGEEGQGVKAKGKQVTSWGKMKK